MTSPLFGMVLVEGYDCCLIYLVFLVDFTVFAATAFLATGFLAAGFAALLALNNCLHLLFPDNTFAFLTITKQTCRSNSPIGPVAEYSSRSTSVLRYAGTLVARKGPRRHAGVSGRASVARQPAPSRTSRAIGKPISGGRGLSVDQNAPLWRHCGRDQTLKRRALRQSDEECEGRKGFVFDRRCVLPLVRLYLAPTPRSRTAATGQPGR